jgi:protein ImuB
MAAGSSPDVCLVGAGAEAEMLAVLPVERLASLDADESVLTTFRRWGLQTLGDIAALPADALSARLGAAGVEWQRLARGEDVRPLRPTLADERFEQTLDLEWPIEGLEPLAFVLARLLDPLSAHLERRGRSAVVLRLVLHLVTRTVHERELQLPAPMRDAVTFRTLLLLDLESHPPPAAIDRVTVAVEPTPARVLQFSLLTRALPSPERLSTLTARLGALVGEGRCGSPAIVDSWRPGAHAVVPFMPRESDGIRRIAAAGERETVIVALRRFRVPVAATVRIDGSQPAHVATGRRDLGGPVEMCAGPWRTSGAWWERGAWDRDEWDVTLRGGVTCRLFRDRSTNAWFVEGIVD